MRSDAAPLIIFILRLDFKNELKTQFNTSSVALLFPESNRPAHLHRVRPVLSVKASQGSTQAVFFALHVNFDL